MAQVRDIAKIVGPRSGRTGTELAQQAFLVWSAARARESRLGEAHLHQGVAGRIYRGNLTQVILGLWPRLSHASARHELDTFRSDVYRYLRASGNAVCIKSGVGGKNIEWWLRDGWNASAVTVALSRMTAAERRLTPHEAGEDREPAPVVTTEVRTDEGTSSMPVNEKVEAAFRARRERKAEEHAALVEMVYELLSTETGDQPVTAAEVAHATGVDASTARTCLQELTEAGRTFTRTETPEERRVRYGGMAKGTRSQLWSTVDPVPERTERQVVDGFRLSPSPTAQGSRGQARLEIMRALDGTFTTVREVADRAGRTPGSVRELLRDMHAEGLIDRGSKKSGGTHLVAYRRLRTAPRVAVPAPDPAPSPASTEPTLREQVERLLERIDTATDTRELDAARDRITELEMENTELRGRIAELESALEPLRRYLG